MKNKKGFTLIELLAVIVVLAISALIATTIVMNTIKNAKKGAAERSADNYVKAVEQKVAESRIDGTKISDGIYNIKPDGNLCPASGCGENDKDKIIIDMSGNKPTSGTVTISNGEVSSTDTIMTVGDYDVKYNQEKNKYEATNEGGASSTTIVYSLSTVPINISDVIDTGDTTKYTNNSDTLGKDYYLKHVLDKDNKVIKSYACANFGEEYCLTNGEYGWSENEINYTGNLLVLNGYAEKEYLGGCHFIHIEEKEATIGIDVTFLATYLDEHVRSWNSSYGSCQVNNDGSSVCESY